MSTRPRISFDSRGWCNACCWMEQKKVLDWSSRREELRKLLEKHRRTDGGFDCLVPVSGGKDGSYVSHKLKDEYGMNPLCVTVTPPLPLTIGEKNLRAFIESGYNHISINPNPKTMSLLDRRGFCQMGFPYFGWLTAVHSAPVIMALKFKIGVIFYGEDGEVEYGGSKETAERSTYNIDYAKRIYLEGGYSKVIDGSGLSEKDLHFFRFPDTKENVAGAIELTHWSYYENWDPYRNYMVAKEYCGLTEMETGNISTFTNFSQNDQALYALHTYLMYLKFGFGRANQDACIEVRRGAMDREQAVSLVRLYDGKFPEEFVDLYLDYYQMTRYEFHNVIDSWANKTLFKKLDGLWRPQFMVR